MFKKKKFILLGSILGVAFIALGFMAFKGAATYYYKVSEVVNMGSSVYGQNIRVNGKVAPGTVVKEDQGRTLRFTVIDETASLPVYFQGTLPDTFKEDAEIVAEGKLNSDGVFQAISIIAKCPSKYEEATPAAVGVLEGVR